ncbi:8165_t:CDS:2 [Paraglomus occultum]|uniref:8165_t:CDS:1 n=1 Tax=Paraglomus occultum TaxID=144539 RepID=A0A9N9AI36_9GLOM|nr:8165_t:CDS:2 [Paraglomus occultum]
MLWSYSKAVTTSPGHPSNQAAIQQSYNPVPPSEHLQHVVDVDDGSNVIVAETVITVKNNGNKRYSCVEFVSASREAFIELDLHWTFLVLVSGVFTLCLVGFVIYHTNLICHNQTTLESMQVKNYKVKDDGEVTTSKYLNLFDVGMKNNWVQVMGPQWYFWFVPVYNSYGDGKTWPLNSHHYSTLRDSIDEPLPLTRA